MNKSWLKGLQNARNCISFKIKICLGRKMKKSLKNLIWCLDFDVKGNDMVELRGEMSLNRNERC